MKNIKVGLTLFKNFGLISFNESSQQVMKNVFQFILKALFVIETFKFLPRLFCSCRKTAWIINLNLTSNFIKPSSGKQIIKIHILPYISRSKNNQKMKLGQLTEYKRERHYSLKILEKMRQGDCSRPFFVF